MSEELAPQTPQPEAAETVAAELDWKAEAERWKAMSKKNEATAKANVEAAKRLAEMEEAQKTVEQKAAERAATTERERDTAKLEALRLSVAIDKGLTKVQAKRLIGSTEEELAADADELLASFARPEPAPEPPDPAVPTRPKEALKSGATKVSGSDVTQLTKEDVEHLYRAGRHDDIEAARKEGRLNNLLGIT